MGGGKKSQLIGYKYYAGMHMVICHGPVDSVQTIEAGEKVAWSGEFTTSGDIYINQPQLFGGDRKEGGIVGTVSILMGETTQGKNGYLAAQLGPTVPGFRGVLSLVLNKLYLTAMTPYVKPWAVRVKRISGRDWMPSTADIANGSANPAHMIRELLINPSWGLGYNQGKIDEPTFQASAQQLYNEGFGMSVILTGQSSVEDFILTILRTIGAVLYCDRITGYFKLKLIRQDYTVSALPLFDENNIVQLDSFERPQYAEMVNEVIIVYRPRGTRKNSSVTAQDLASIQAQGGVVSQTINYIGVDSIHIASVIAARELRQFSTPFAKIKITTNRDGWKLEPGELFRFSWSKHNIIEMVCRVLTINLGDLTNGEIIIEAVEDIFALPQTSYLGNQEPQWVDPISAPIAITTKVPKELNYWDIQRTFEAGDIAAVDPTSAYFHMLVKKPNIATPGYQLLTKPSGAASFNTIGTGVYTPYGILESDLGYADTTNIELSILDLDGRVITPGTYAYIDDEIVRVTSVDVNLTRVTLGRGCLDTVAAKHLAGAYIWFSEEYSSDDPTEYAQGQIVNAKTLTQTSSSVLPEGSDILVALTLAGRQNRPYPPARLRINSLAYPAEIAAVPVLISWGHRDRTLQLATVVSEDEADIGPETGVTYNLKLYDENDVPRVNLTGITGTSYNWTTEVADSLLGRLNEFVRVELWSVRAGIESWQRHNLRLYRPQVPFNTVLPYISGTPSVGSILTVANGTWDFHPTAYTYQWTRNLANILGQTADTYTVVTADEGANISCKVTATNTAGSTTALSSNAAAIPGAGGGDVLWQPVNIPGGAIWYDASDASYRTDVSGGVDTLLDKGGSNRVFTQTDATKRPTLAPAALNGLTAIRFDGTTDELACAIDMPGDAMTWVIFHKLNSLPGSGIFRAVLNMKAGAKGITELLTCNYAGYTPYQIVNDLVGSANGVGISDALDTNLKALAWTYDNSTNSAVGSYKIRLNGVAKTVVVSGNTSITDGTSSKIGTRLAQDFRSSMDLYEIIGIPGVASNELLEQVEGYLFHKWGSASVLPAGHPYKLGPPVL